VSEWKPLTSGKGERYSLTEDGDTWVEYGHFQCPEQWSLMVGGQCAARGRVSGESRTELRACAAGQARLTLAAMVQAAGAAARRVNSDA